MLKLELVRFSFSPVVTYGVMHSRDGWSCFTAESVVLNTVTPPVGKAALGEGLYRLHFDKEATTTNAIHIVDVEGEPPLARICAAARAYLMQANITVGYGIDTIACTMADYIPAYLDLCARIEAAPEAYLNIRHLDNTQLHHFQRMAREGIQ